MNFFYNDYINAKYKDINNRLYVKKYMHQHKSYDFLVCATK